MLWFILKERHTLINTFCSQSNLKPFSTKLLVLIFSLTCYFVINGFLYNEEYVSQKMDDTQKEKKQIANQDINVKEKENKNNLETKILIENIFIIY